MVQMFENSPAEVCRNLISLASNRGAPDNVTIIVLIFKKDIQKAEQAEDTEERADFIRDVDELVQEIFEEMILSELVSQQE